jgi:PIN domain nuclease of toxin-antitoxin system
MIAAVADTHSIIWYLSGDKNLSQKAKSFMDNINQRGDTIAISSITLVEMVYLVEKGRIPPERFTQLAISLDNPNSFLVEIPVNLQIVRSMSRVDVAQIPDMPDRLVAASAIHLNVSVISKDRKIRLSSIQTIW